MAEPTPIQGETGSFASKMSTALAELAELDKIALVFLFFERIVTAICFSALLSAFPPFMQTILNKSPDVATLYVAASQSVVGIVAIITVAAFVFTPIGKVRSSPILFFALGCYAIMYFYSYPWAPISQPIIVRSLENPHGCNVTELRWCGEQSHVKIWYWVPVTAVLFGMAVPTSMIFLDTVYSKLLGNIDQNLMQGVLVLIDDAASSVAPIVTMKIFTEYGPDVFWLVLGGNALTGFLAWIPMVSKMQRLKI